jgi:S1-C subfamily serine protease
MRRISIKGAGLTAIPFLFAILLYSDAPAESRRPGYLGVSIEKLSIDDKQELKADFGVRVGDVSEDSPAEKAGIREDDVIQTYNGDKIRRTQDLIRRVRETKPGTKVRIGLVRESKSMEVETEIGRLHRSEIIVNGRDTGRFRRSGRGALGVRLHGLNADLSGYFKVKEDEGALVTEVEEDGPADKAGIKAGDVLVQIGGDPVHGPEDVPEILSGRDEGDEVEITLIRKGIRQTVKAEVEERNFQFQLNMPEMNIHVPDIDIEVPDVPEVPQLDIHVDLDRDFMDGLKHDMNDLKIELKRELKGLEELKELDCSEESSRI